MFLVLFLSLAGCLGTTKDSGDTSSFAGFVCYEAVADCTAGSYTNCWDVDASASFFAYARQCGGSDETYACVDAYVTGNGTEGAYQLCATCTGIGGDTGGGASAYPWTELQVQICDPIADVAPPYEFLSASELAGASL